MIALLLTLLASEIWPLVGANAPTTAPTTVQPTPAPTPECPGCIEWRPDVYQNGTVLGTCCLSDKSLGSDYTQARCPYVWIGPGTSASDCADHHPCCFEEQGGYCSLERCFDCVTKGGKLVHDCKHCEDKSTTTTTVATTTTVETGPTLPPHPEATDPPPTGQGCCCVHGGNPMVMDPHACHECDGVYQGDGVPCDPDTCRQNCCEVATRECGECPHYANPEEFVFVGFGPECEPEACGVTCCHNAHAIEASSSDHCEWAGGEAFPNVTLAQADCGGGCCVDLNFTVVANETECAGRWLGLNVGYSPGVCGGACCSDGECMIASAEECGLYDAVYQGDDVECTEDDDDDPWGVCQNDGCCCLPDGGGSVLVASARKCYELRGIFQGEGSECLEDTCNCGVCCSQDEFGGREVQNEVECDLFDGRYAGDGSKLDMPGVCDNSGGACVCGDQCYDVPSAAACTLLHGESFRGVGTSCKDHYLAPVPEDPEDEGQCCVPRSFHSDHAQCVMLPNRKRCEFRGGVWGGAGTSCDDETCKEIRGACCSPKEGETGVNGEPVYSCQPDLTLGQCRECGGHWGGANSRCDDEYSCQPESRGACCRHGHACSMASVTACRRSGGNFQGFETTCEDLDGQICKHCAPAEVDAPECSDSLPCANSLATCIGQYGKCMVIATPIASEYNYTVDPWTTSAPAPPATTAPSPPVRKRLLPTTTASTTGSTTPASTTTTTTAGPPTTTAKPKPTPPPSAVDYAGPLSCGPGNSTLGLPCLGAPLFGKCRIGVCVAPPEGSGLTGDGCESVCRHIKEYPCGCAGDGDWLKKCASLAGRVIDDRNNNTEYDEFVDAGVPLALVELFLFDGAGGYDFVAEQHSGVSGHYAFVDLAPGKYRVRVTLPNCFAHQGETNSRIVTLSCVESALAALRSNTGFPSSGSFAVEHHKLGAHLATNIDFFAIEDCDEAAAQQDEQEQNGGDIGSASDTDDDDSGPVESSGSSTGLIIGLTVAAVAAFVVLAICATRRRKRRARGGRRRGRRD